MNLGERPSAVVAVNNDAPGSTEDSVNNPENAEDRQVHAFVAKANVKESS